MQAAKYFADYLIFILLRIHYCDGLHTKLHATTVDRIGIDIGGIVTVKGDGCRAVAHIVGAIIAVASEDNLGDLALAGKGYGVVGIETDTLC